MLLNVVISLVPRPFTTAMIATEMPAAIRPYSIAVAPDSSFTKRETRVFMRMAPLGPTRTVQARPNGCCPSHLDRGEPKQRDIAMPLHRSPKRRRPPNG